MPKSLLNILLIFSFLTLAIHSQSQVVINEFCAKNIDNILDFEGTPSDWVEIYNGNDSPYDLTGHFLSDNFIDAYKWEFPSIVLQPNTRILVFASSKDTIANFPHTNFKLSSNGEEIIFSAPDSTTIDSIDYGVTEPNFSLGRLNDGSDTWGCYSVPTPNGSNSLSSGTISCYIGTPDFNLESGFYEALVSLDITTTSGDSIFYTTDGSTPTLSSLPFINPIQIDTTTVFRAISYNSSTGYYSLPESHTYIINEGLEDIPIISICTDPCNLWSDEKGIYIAGPNADTIFPFYGSNFWNGWEIPIELEFFESDKTLAFEGRYDMKIHGGKGARTRPMKPLRIMAKNKYDQPYINYKVFDRKEATQFKRLVLRNSGSDFNQTYFRDGIVHDLALKEKLNIDVTGYRPCIVFLNGTYWGLQNIREKIDEYYIQSNHDVDINNLDMLEENDQIIVGDFSIFEMHETFINNNDLSIEENFQTAAAWFDLESMSDYFITQTFHNNYDWPNNNLKFWRERKDDAKWRYVMFDLDYGLNPINPNEVNYDLVFFTFDQYKENNRHVKILLKFLENPEFKRYFINRYADLVNTIFSTDYYHNHLNETKDRIAPFIERHYTKWNTPISDWENQINDFIIPFIEQRPAVIQEDLRNTFGLESTVNLNFKVFPENAGKIKINTLSEDAISFPWSGIYFKDVAIDITAVENEDYIFEDWQNANGEIISSAKALKRAFEDNEIITAVFKEKSSVNSLEIIPNPTTDFIIINTILPNENEVFISIYNTSGKLMLQQNKGTLPSDIYSFSLENLQLSSGVYFLEITQGDFKEVKRFVIK